jgi:hypothetical protein
VGRSFESWGAGIDGVGRARATDILRDAICRKLVRIMWWDEGNGLTSKSHTVLEGSIPQRRSFNFRVGCKSDG